MSGARLLAGIAAALLACGSGAAELEYGVEVGIGTSDNIGRARENGESEEIATAGLNLSIAREGGRVEADVEVDLSYFDYLSDAFDSEMQGFADADIRFNFVPERFIWVLTENFGQSQLDPFVPTTPINTENINYLTTGPDIAVRLGARGSLTIFGRYSMTTYEESNFDDERLMGGISLARETSERSDLSLNATTERVEFDDPAFGSNYDRQSAFVRYDIDGARTRIGAEAGYAEIHDLESTSSGPLLEIDIERDISERSILALLGGVRSSDAATALRAGYIFGSTDPGRPGQVSSADPYTTDHVSLGWLFTAPRTDVMLSAGYEKDVYETQSELDRERYVYEAMAQRQITPRLSVRIMGTLSSYKFDESGQEDDETEFNLNLSWNVSGRLYVEVEVYQFDRDSTNLLTEYNETRYFLRFAWRNVGVAAETS